ncbi:unnamed protein product [Soboliphyme baturini]|uniref:Uncharacterized protein n=1 Tax=Soboliphyme baturini TaxID=241478 RepID=A0A183IVP8_9BILA|nr:unnamed protein product [Soboliphyme baturini]
MVAKNEIDFVLFDKRRIIRGTVIMPYFIIGSVHCLVRSRRTFEERIEWKTLQMANHSRQLKCSTRWPQSSQVKQRQLTKRRKGSWDDNYEKPIEKFSPCVK